jgi:cardiolipin synthase
VLARRAAEALGRHRGARRHNVAVPAPIDSAALSPCPACRKAWRRAAGTALVVLATLGAACSSTPTRVATAPAGSAASAAPPPAASAAAPGSVTVIGARGPVSGAEEAAALGRLRAEGLQPLLDRQLRALASHGEVDLHRGNQTRLLVDGPATFAAMKASIDKAQDRVLLQSYIVESEGVAGEVAALLLKKAAAGVKVALLYDAVGSVATPKAFFDGLAQGGVAVCQFNPLDPTHRPGWWSINHRDHRKLLVVDNEVGYTGGINISRVYGSSPGAGGSGRFGSGAPAASALEEGWRDTQIELRGPVVPALAQVFATTWHSQGCKGDLGQPRRTATETGQRIVKVLTTDPRDERNRIYDALLQAIREAQNSVKLTMAYFAPGGEFIGALENAARRGVAVELVLSGHSDFTLVLHAGRSYYTRLLKAGVRIHEMEGAVMHAKSAVIDGVFATVGSTNLDWRSIVNNNELNVIVLGEDFGAQMAALFDRDRAASREVTLQAWRERGIGQRAREWLGRIAEPFL